VPARMVPQTGAAPAARWNDEPEKRVTQKQLSAPAARPRWAGLNPIDGERLSPLIRLPW